MKKLEDRLKELGIELLSLRLATGNYVGCKRTGNIIFTAAQGIDQYHGKLGRELTAEEGNLSAQEFHV